MKGGRQAGNASAVGQPYRGICGPTAVEWTGDLDPLKQRLRSQEVPPQLDEGTAAAGLHFASERMNHFSTCRFGATLST